MKRFIAIVASAAAIWGSVAGATASVAQASSASTTTYFTTLTQTRPLPSSGVLPGRLNLKISSEGLVSGWYVPEYEGAYVPVTGAKDGNRLRLEIGERGSVRVDATVQKDGTIVGTATDLDTLGLPPTGAPVAFDFVAKPAKNGQAAY